MALCVTRSTATINVVSFYELTILDYFHFYLYQHYGLGTEKHPLKELKEELPITRRKPIRGIINQGK